jgi:Zn finger protein HypA/HybF involved in hydrogenase expression
MTISKPVEMKPALKPVNQGSPAEQVRLIMTHPFFSGKCPHCKRKVQLVKTMPGKCHCLHCGWSDIESVIDSTRESAMELPVDEQSFLD